MKQRDYRLFLEDIPETQSKIKKVLEVLNE